MRPLVSIILVSREPESPLSSYRAWYMLEMELRSNGCCCPSSSRSVIQAPTPNQGSNDMPKLHANELVPIIVRGGGGRIVFNWY